MQGLGVALADVSGMIDASSLFAAFAYGISGSFIGLGIFFAIFVVIAGQLLTWPPKDYVPPQQSALNASGSGKMTTFDWSAPAMM